MKLPSIKKDLLKNPPEDKLEEASGIILYYLNDHHYKSYDDVVKAIKEENGSNPHYGFHYIISKEGTITKLVENTIAVKYIGENPTYINSNLYEGKASSKFISILIHLEEKGDSEKLDLTLVRFLAELVKEHKLTAKDIWRGMDLYTDIKEPLHYFDQFIFAKLIKEVEKFIPPEKEGTDGMESGTDKEEEVDPPIGPPNPEEDKEIIFDEVKFVSPFSYYLKDEQTVDEYIRALFLAHMPDIDKYLALHKPWDKDIEGATSSETTMGELKNKVLPTKNTLQYQVGQGSPTGSCSCEKPADHIKGTHLTSPTMVEPIYPDLITPPGGTLHVAGGESSGAAQSSSETPLTQEEFEKRQDTFNIKDFKNIEKETFGRPINPDDPFPVDEQIKKLEEHFPKVKVDKITMDFDDTNHLNSVIGAAMAKNLAMTYDIAEEVSKRVEQRLVKIENNLATTMRNLFRMSSRVNINCVYYGGQSVYGKYNCIRCLDDRRIHDGAVVSLDQCLTCTRYEPIAGQIYAILDEAGSNITKVMDDMQMAYLDEHDVAEGTRIEEYWNSPNAANVKLTPTEEPVPFSKGLWADGEEEMKSKLEGLEEDSEEYKKAIEEYKNGFVMEWTVGELELQKPNVAKYEFEEEELNKPVPESDVDTIDREAFIDTREDAASYEKLEFHVDKYKFNDFGINNGVAGGGSGGSGDGGAARRSIVAYAEKVVALGDKAKYSQGQRYKHEPKDENGGLRTGPDSNGVHWYDCSSLVETAFLQAGVAINAPTTGPQFNKCKDAAGGELFGLSQIDQAKPGDIIFFDSSVGSNHNMTREQLNAHGADGIRHVALYIGDGMCIHAVSEKWDIKKTEVDWDKGAFCFGRTAELIAKDQMGGSGVMPQAWDREFQGIDDALWERAKVADSNVNGGLVPMMEKYKYKDVLKEVAEANGFDPIFIAAVISVESSGNPMTDNPLYPGIIQCTGGYTTSTIAGIKDNIQKGCDFLKNDMAWLTKHGWKGENLHLLASTHNCGRYGVVDAMGYTKESKPSASIPMLGEVYDLNTSKVPLVSSVLGRYVDKYQPSWSKTEKETYAVKVLRAYNIIYEKNLLDLPKPEMPEGVPKITKNHIQRHAPARTQPIKYIVIHDVGGPMQAPSCREWFNNPDSKVSTHYVVDDEMIIEMADPVKQYCWHSGDGPGTSGITNRNSIGIEMGLYKGGGVGNAPGHITGVLHQKTIDNTVGLVKMLMQQHNIPKSQVVRHKDATGKNCPMQMSENNFAKWNEFKSRL